ncbi:putative cystathionine gamma-lyase 2 isoform X2 [Lycorma delicatula]|uniref:putative cystathionine gamma-lyase 2 isoform X2 n=1 Tax=Lycorma delicatula TaxID=130591 RepID=UPI003F510735
MMTYPENRALGFQKRIDPNFGTKACTIGQEAEQWGYMDVVPPICVSSTFKQIAPTVTKFEYGRGGNPSRDLLERCLASLDDAKYGICFASGLGALTSVVTLLQTGDHILAVDDLYGGTNRFFRNIASRYGLESTFLNAEDPEKFVSAMKPNTKLIWLESPTNPTLRVWDVEMISKLAKKKQKDVIIVLDNTFLTSYFQRPLELGADIAMYSATKYLNGHSDVIMGALTLNDDELFKRLKYNQNTTGIIPSPIDCFLVNRSIKTLHIRMDEHMRNGLAVARYLEAHQDVEKVLHPGLPSHPHHKLALRQWSGHSGMVSFYHKYGLDESKKFLQLLKVFSLAESLGGHKSLAEIPILMTHASVPANERIQLGIKENFIRLSVGLESIPDLLEDLGQALKNMKK